MKVNKRHFCLEGVRSPCLLSAKDAVHHCCAAWLHSAGLPHDGTVCTFTSCCILPLPLCFTGLSRACTVAGIVELWSHTNRKVFCWVESLLMYRFIPTFTYFYILKMFMCGCCSIVIQENPELNQCFEKWRPKGKKIFVVLGLKMSGSGNYRKVQHENPLQFSWCACPRPVNKIKDSAALVEQLMKKPWLLGPGNSFRLAQPSSKTHCF